MRPRVSAIMMVETRSMQVLVASATFTLKTCVLQIVFDMLLVYDGDFMGGPGVCFALLLLSPST